MVRSEGAIDTRTRQLYVIAQVDDPYSAGHSGARPLKIGQFVQADIEGKTLEQVFVVPRGTLRAGDTVLLVDDQEQLRSRPVDVVWTDSANAVISTGITTGDRIVTTALGEGLDGTPVRIKGAAQPKRRAGSGAADQPRGGTAAKTDNRGGTAAKTGAGRS